MDIQASLDSILACDLEFIESFYRQLENDFPGVFRHSDGVDMKHQAHMLNTSLLLCVQGSRIPNKSIEHYLRILGTKHNRVGVERGAYTNFITTLMKSLESSCVPRNVV